MGLTSSAEGSGGTEGVDGQEGLPLDLTAGTAETTECTELIAEWGRTQEQLRASRFKRDFLDERRRHRRETRDAASTCSTNPGSICVSPRSGPGCSPSGNRKRRYYPNTSSTLGPSSPGQQVAADDDTIVKAKFIATPPTTPPGTPTLGEVDQTEEELEAACLEEEVRAIYLEDLASFLYRQTRLIQRRSSTSTEFVV
mmetsp:Transcript_66379/g.187616  ORF Transcript_66379/g.187616 Transcript_66379/m.187616 type:complete len:198 (+) Transcript_66379:58-651(+)